MSNERIRTGFWAVVLAISLAVFGCNDKGPLDPGGVQPGAEQSSYVMGKGKGNNNGGGSGDASTSSGSQITKLSKSISTCDGSIATMRMKPEQGGTLELCGNSMIIPPGALDKQKTMSIEVLNSAYMDVEFGPDGAFLKPITVRLSYKDANLTGVDINKLYIAWYDEANNKWVDIGGVVNQSGKYVEAQTDHFTQYTLSLR